MRPLSDAVGHVLHLPRWQSRDQRTDLSVPSGDLPFAAWRDRNLAYELAHHLSQALRHDHDVFVRLRRLRLGGSGSYKQ
ncbi:MAG: hypothetical protein AB7T59_02535 [Hyphomonadaceae bacterium]